MLTHEHVQLFVILHSIYEALYIHFYSSYYRQQNKLKYNAKNSIDIALIKCKIKIRNVKLKEIKFTRYITGYTYKQITLHSAQSKSHGTNSGIETHVE